MYKLIRFALFSALSLTGVNAVGAEPARSPVSALTFVEGPVNAEDLLLIPGTRWVLTSGSKEGSGLHLIHADRKQAQSAFPEEPAGSKWDKQAFGSCPGPLDKSKFIAHGISLRQTGNKSFNLYVVTHGTREAIEVFGLDSTPAVPALSWKGCVLMPSGLAANSVTSFADGTIMATVLIHPDKSWTEMLGGKPTGGVYEWKPGAPSFRLLAGSELAGNNGIEAGLDGKTFFVAASGSQTIVRFSRTNPVKVEKVAQLHGFAPDNVHWDKENRRLITAGMLDDEPACGGPPVAPKGGRADFSCPRGYAVDAIDPTSMSVTSLARGTANPLLTRYATALVIDKEIWLGPSGGDRIGIHKDR
jgi:hypothetical protein